MVTSKNKVDWPIIKNNMIGKIQWITREFPIEFHNIEFHTTSISSVDSQCV